MLLIVIVYHSFSFVVSLTATRSYSLSFTVSLVFLFINYHHLLSFSKFIQNYYMLRILTGKKHRQIKFQRIRKVQIWAFDSLVHQINSLEEVFKLKQNFQKNKVVTGKTPLFVIGPFCSRHSICLNIGF